MIKQQPRSKPQGTNHTIYSVISKGQTSQESCDWCVLCHPITDWLNDKDQHPLPTSISKAADANKTPIASAQNSVHTLSQGFWLRSCRLFTGWASPKWSLSCSDWKLPASSRHRGASHEGFQFSKMGGCTLQEKKQIRLIWTSQKSNFSFFHFGNILLLEFFALIILALCLGPFMFSNDFYGTNNVSKVWMGYGYPINTIFSKFLLIFCY